MPSYIKYKCLQAWQWEYDVYCTQIHVQMQFVESTTPVATVTGGRSVFAPIHGQDPTVPNTVRL